MISKFSHNTLAANHYTKMYYACEFKSVMMTTGASTSGENFFQIRNRRRKNYRLRVKKKKNLKIEKFSLGSETKIMPQQDTTSSLSIASVRIENQAFGARVPRTIYIWYRGTRRRGHFLKKKPPADCYAAAAATTTVPRRPARRAGPSSRNSAAAVRAITSRGVRARVFVIIVVVFVIIPIYRNHGDYELRRR